MVVEMGPMAANLCGNETFSVINVFTVMPDHQAPGAERALIFAGSARYTFARSFPTA
jgi:hypothetical protein